MPSQGDLLGDRYRLDDPIATGGMGQVWRATDTLLGRAVAVKLLHHGRSGDREFQARFHHEAKAMAALRHPGIATVYDYGQTGPGADAYIVMAHIDGQPLDQRIAEDGRLDAATAMSVVLQAARALDAAHAVGIVHRDVKPGNLIVQPDGTVVLVDFGVARSPALAAVTGTNDIVGTALYIAPEQVSKAATGPATDIYALGAVAYHCVAGRPPFIGDNPVSIAVHHLNDDPPPLPPGVPAPVRELIATAMAKRPADRYPSAAAMAAAATSSAEAGPAGTPAPADADATARPIAAGGPAGDEPTGGSPHRSTALWTLVLLALAGLAVGLAVAVAIALSGPDSIFRDPGSKATPTSTGLPGTDRSGGVRTTPGGGSAPPGSTATSGGAGEATPGTGGGGTQPGGGGPTPQNPQPTPTQPAPATTAPETTAPAASAPAGTGGG